MYLKGSKFSIQSRRKRGNPWLILFLLLGIAGLIYLNIVVVPMINPPFVPTPTPTRDPESYVTEADTLAEEGKYIQAVEVYQQAINANPQNIDNYLKIARLQIFTSQLEQAQVNAQNAILLDSGNSDAYALLGWAKAFQREYLAGEADVRKAVELDQNSGLAHAIYAYILALRVEARMDELDTMDRAIEESRTALALEPNLMEAHWARGYVLEVTANFAEAVESLKTANQINPNVDRLHMALGRNLTYIDQLDQAVFEFTKAYSLNPSSPAPNLAISQVYSRLGEFDKAIQYGEVALRDGPTQANLYANLGTLYYRKSQFNAAIEYLRIAVRGGLSEEGLAVEGIPLSYELGVVEIYSRYGLALAKINECNEAVSIAEGIRQTVPDSAVGQENAAIIIKTCEENLLNPPTPTTAPTPTVVTGPTATPEGEQP
jgi:tetratricopeptide (TPR) repeat protein